MNNQIRIIRARDVRKILEGKEEKIMELVKSTYIMHDKGISILPKSIFLHFPNDTKNRIIGLPAYLGGDLNIAGIKWISSFPDNINHKMERASAINILNSMENGRCETILEGSIISAKRTAASAALAAFALHENKEEKTIGIVGCGRINREIYEFLKRKFVNVKHSVLFDLSRVCAENMKMYIEKNGMSAEIVDSVEAVFERSHLVSFATTASVPYLGGISNIDERTTVLNISLRDFTPEMIEACDNIVDDEEHVLREKTSVALTAEKRQNSDFIRCNLAKVLTGEQKPRKDNRAVIFSPFGLGILDLALNHYVNEQAKKLGLGIIIDNFIE